MLEILYQDEHYLAINKPNGLLVHRSKIAKDAQDFALQQLRDQVQQRVYLVHRLDRPTSGVLLFGKSSEAARQAVEAFTLRAVEKTYWAIVRGYTEPSGEINKPIQSDDSPAPQEAITCYQRLKTIELPHAVGRYPTARYSWVEIQPKTGRMHQIRRHFKSIFHHIIGDSRYGDHRHNKFFSEQFGSNSLQLHARSLAFHHPYADQTILITATPPLSMMAIFRQFDWEN